MKFKRSNRDAEVASDGEETPLSYAVLSDRRDAPALVRGALSEGRTQLAIHAVVAASDPERVIYHEALVRLADERGHIIPAGDFIGFVQDTVLGRELDCAVLILAIKALQAKPDLRLSVNVSARSLGDAQWRRQLDDMLMRQPELGERLIFEISESSAMQLPDVVMRFMTEVQPKGVCFALDGFGAGMTAFRHLRDFFFDFAKIDKSFIRGIEGNPDNQVLAEALATVARQFDMYVIADGVETAEEAEFLRTLDVDCMQGYLFGKPRLDLDEG